jgi:son of sevenless
MNTFENIPKDALQSYRSLRLYLRTQLRKDPALRVRMFDEIECQNNIRVTAVGIPLALCGPDTVKGGTVEKLVQRLTHEKFVSLNYTRCFLLLYPSFCTARDLLQLLILRFTHAGRLESEQDADNQRIIRLRVLNTISKWMDLHPHHFSDLELVQQVSHFVHSLPDDDSSKIHKSFKLITEGVSAKLPKASSQAVNPKPIMPPPSPSGLTITSIDPVEMARQLCLLECKKNHFLIICLNFLLIFFIFIFLFLCFSVELMSQVAPEEFLNQRWTKADKHVQAPNLMRWIAYFNKFSGIVVSTILKYKDTKQRVQVMSLFMLCADECLRLNHFNAVSQIVAAIESIPISRLKVTWKVNIELFYFLLMLPIFINLFLPNLKVNLYKR